MFAYCVVNFAFPENPSPFQAVKSHRLVLKKDNSFVGIVRGVNLLSLAFPQNGSDFRHTPFLHFRVWISLAFFALFLKSVKTCRPLPNFDKTRTLFLAFSGSFGFVQVTKVRK